MRVLGDYDIWYQPCKHCGYDTGKSRKLDDPRCCQCGRFIKRDYSDRALKNMNKECKFCYKKFEAKENENCCCDDCENKYNNYLANNDSEKPWDKLVN